MAPVIMGNPDRPGLGAELTNSFCRADPDIAADFARVTFFSDNREDLPWVKTPTLILQCSEDVIAPDAVGEYVHRRMPSSQLVRMRATGHCPNLSGGDGRRPVRACAVWIPVHASRRDHRPGQPDVDRLDAAHARIAGVGHKVSVAARHVDHSNLDEAQHRFVRLLKSSAENMLKLLNHVRARRRLPVFLQPAAGRSQSLITSRRSQKRLTVLSGGAKRWDMRRPFLV